MDSTTAMRNIAKLDLDPIKVKLMHRESGEGWTLEHAHAIEVEYRRFLCLMQLYPYEDFAPLLDVDIFWHYHILDTRKYAADCQQAFGHFIHHHPYVGLGADDGSDHQAYGTRMHELYQATFGQPCLAGAGSADNAWGTLERPQAQLTAYCSATGAAAAQRTAYCSATSKPLQTAYCSVSAKALQTSYCSAPGTLLQTAYCSASGTSLQTAYCSAPGKPLQTAYCSAPGKPLQTAYCSAPGTSLQTAYCSVSAKARQTAYCSSPALAPAQPDAWPSRGADCRQTEWSAPANQATLLAA